MDKARSIAVYVYRFFFARDGFLGVEGTHFETIFFAREIFETVLQTKQAYQMSLLLPDRALNRFYAVVLVVNCWSTPMLSHFIKHKPLQKLLCILSDIILDFVSSIGVPVYLAIPYIKLYDPGYADLPHSF